jgi:anti-sigma B factor antagonist
VTEQGLDITWSGRHAIVTMPAEIDLINAGRLGDQLSAVGIGSPEVITVDLTATTFCDSAGIRALARAHEQAADCGAELRLAVGDSPVRRILQLTGLDQILPIYRDVRQSLATPRATPLAGPTAGPARNQETSM